MRSVTWAKRAVKLAAVPLVAAVVGTAGGSAQAATIGIAFNDQTASFVNPVANPLAYPEAVFSSDNGLRIFTFTGGAPLDRGLCPHATNACRSALTIDFNVAISSLTFSVFQVDEADSVLAVSAISAGGAANSNVALTKGWNSNVITLTGLTGVTRLVLDGRSDEEGVIYDNFRLQTADGDNGGGSPVPEPATWALMIAGFGLAGSALRRRALA